ncbi:MAG: UbiA family prenyltransferase [Desulfobacterales bacterium]|nr:UbiA family prenyltransferase [Desulfobacterales bacterium]
MSDGNGFLAWRLERPEPAPPGAKKPPGRLVSFLKLSKIVLSLHIGMAAAAGCLFHSDGRVLQALMLWLGVTLVSMAGALFNNIQDRMDDRLLVRTLWRFDMIERAGIGSLLKGGGLMALAGLLLVLDASGGILPPTLVLGGLVVYNGVYTPLKRFSSLALVPGALCGVLALLSGWTASGGSLLSRGGLSAALVVGLWQFPHTMVQNLKDADALRDHPRPSLPRLFDSWQLAHVSLLWTMLYNLSLYHLLFIETFSSWALALLFANAGFLTPLFAHTLFVLKRFLLSFHLLNTSLLAFFIALMIS